MNQQTQTAQHDKPSDGATRAAREVWYELCRDVPLDLETLARIIDRETAAPELLAACEQLMQVLGSDTDDPAFDWVHAAIAKARG